MYNLLISIALGLVAWAILPAFGLIKWVEAIGLGILAFLIAMVLLGRRSMKSLEAVMAAVQGDVMAQRFDMAVNRLKAALPMAKWQFLVGAQLHGHIGYILYLQRKFDDALPHLEASYPKGYVSKRLVRHWIAHSMLAAQAWREKNTTRALDIMEVTVTANEKESLPWGMYAWMHWKLGALDKAIEVLSRAEKALPADERIKKNLDNLRNGKPMKLGEYSGWEAWYGMHLETPPMQKAQAAVQMHGSKGYAASRMRGARR